MTVIEKTEKILVNKNLNIFDLRTIKSIINEAGRYIITIIEDDDDDE